MAATTMLLLSFFECLACLLVWWGGVTLALADQPGRRSWDALQRQRRAEWVRTELQEQPWWWLMLSGLAALTEQLGWGIRPVSL